MTAPREAVERVEEVLHCAKVAVRGERTECWAHGSLDWTDRGCPVAVAAADAAIDALGLTEETRPSEGNYAGMTTGPGMFEVRVFGRYTEQRRLVGPWTEAQP